MVWLRIAETFLRILDPWRDLLETTEVLLAALFKFGFVLRLEPGVPLPYGAI